MYFVVLRSKQYEMLALRELAVDIVTAGNVVPIIEPMGTDRALELALDQCVESTMRFCLIVNPENGSLINASLAAVKSAVFDAFLDEYDNVIPTFYVDRNTTTADVAEFCQMFNNPRAFFFRGQPANQVVESINTASPVFVMFLRTGGVNATTVNEFAPSISVDIAEAFVPAANNSSFADDEFFSDQHCVMPNADFAHFGDYSIIGRTLTAGWAPYCVAIHYVYQHGAASADLWIRHFKSDTNDTQDDPAGKYREALDKLIAELPMLGNYNRTAATTEFEQDDANNHYPGLPTLKRRGIVHHISQLLAIV